MTDLAISRLSATVHGGGDLAPRVSGMLTQLAQRRLDDALRAADLPPGEWCVRRLDVTLVIDPERPDGTVETRWATAAVDALRRALNTESGNVVHYQRRGDALADLVASVAVGRTERAWAWRRIGVLAPDDPQPESAATESVLAVLRRHPTEVLAVLVRAARSVGVAALHRLFGARGWAELARLVAPASATGLPSTDRSREAHRAAVTALAAELIRRSTLAGAFGRSRLRPDPATASAWAVLICAEADPCVLSRPVATAVIEQVTQTFAGAAHHAAAAVPRGAEQHEHPASCTEPPERAGLSDSLSIAGTDIPVQSSVKVGPQADRSTDQRTEPVELAVNGAEVVADTGRTPCSTEWAGLLFLLNTAAEAGIPEALLNDPPLATRTLPWALHSIAQQLVPAAGDDPAVLAFAALSDPPAGAASEIEDRCLDAHAHRWAVATATRLGREDEDPLAVVAELARRHGEITAEPGWVEVLLPLTEIDIGIRRAGLDIDPGWVRWLGTVVRFGYA